MSMASQTQAYLAGVGISNVPFNTTLRNVGLLAPDDKGEVNYWEYRDSFKLDLAPLASLNKTIKLFSDPIGNGAARNLQGNLTSDIAFFNYRIHVDVDVAYDPAIVDDPSLFDGMFLAEGIDYLLKGTRFNIQVANKNYGDFALQTFANITQPSILDGVKGQLAPGTPVAQFPSTWQSHHRMTLELDPCIIWPANVNVVFAAIVTPALWYADINSGVAPDADTAPWNIAMQPTFTVTCIGNQGRVSK